MGSAWHDRVSLEIAARVAGGLPSHPEWLMLARDNLRRWMDLNRDAPGLMRCYKEWLAVLDRPVEDIRRLLTAETERGCPPADQLAFRGRDLREGSMGDQAEAPG